MLVGKSRIAASLLIFGVVIALFAYLPRESFIQPLGPLAGIIVMYLINTLLRAPSVGIDNLGREVQYEVNRHMAGLITYSVDGLIINKSLTGAGDIRDLRLRVYHENKECYFDIQADDTMYVRLETNGAHPVRKVKFIEHASKRDDISTLSGKYAEILLQVVGQGLKSYKVNMAVKPNYLSAYRQT